MRYYCQFHFSGFRTYFIEGKNNELLDKIVTSENRYSLPLETEEDINNSSLKIVYRQIGDDTLSLTVRGIPSIKTDTSGRPIESAIVIVGSVDDRAYLESLVKFCVSKRTEFDSSVQQLFSLRGGLHIDGDRLVELVDRIQKTPLSNESNIDFSKTKNYPFVCSLPLDSDILDINPIEPTTKIVKRPPVTIEDDDDDDWKWGKIRYFRAIIIAFITTVVSISTFFLVNKHQKSNKKESVKIEKSINSQSEDTITSINTDTTISLL